MTTFDHPWAAPATELPEPRTRKVWIAKMDSEHFEWIAAGSTRMQAQAAMANTMRRHIEQYKGYGEPFSPAGPYTDAVSEAGNRFGMWSLNDWMAYYGIWFIELPINEAGTRDGDFIRLEGDK